MKEAFVRFVRDLKEPVRAQRQEKIREVELGWSADEFAGFRLFVMGLHSSEMDAVCHALSDAQAAPLLEILADFAEKDSNLLNVAFQAMNKTSQEARIFLAKKLMASQKADVRAKTCEMLGMAGRPARPILEKALGDADTNVQYAAIEAISRGGFKNLGPVVLPLLHSADKKVRFAVLEAMARLGADAGSADGDLLAIMRDDRQDDPARRIAAAILARGSNSAARTLMLDALRNQLAPFALRAAAAESLAAYDDPEAIRAVMRAVDDDDTSIAQMAQMSLNRKTTAAFAGILTQILPDENIRMAQLAAELLGGLDVGIAGRALLNLLKTERRIPVISALARAMGKSDVPGAWNTLLARQKKENIDDPDFFSALADVAKEEDLAEFASLFDTVAREDSKHVILDRLASFSRASPVNYEMQSLARRALNSPDKSLHLAAATILAHVDNPDSQDINLILNSLANLGNDRKIPDVILALLRKKHGALADLFQDAPPEAAPLMAYAATEATCMGEKPLPLFRKVAAWVRADTDGAREALRGMAALAPGALVKAMAKCEDQIFLIEAWSGLPYRARNANRPNFRTFFADSSPEDAVAGIQVLKSIQDSRSLQDLADVSFTSGYPEVRDAALSLARELILAQ